MSGVIQFFINKASATDILSHLLACDSHFVASLTARVDLKEYAKKIFVNAERFEAWSGETLVGMVAVYCNERKNRASHITSVSVLNNYRGKGVADQLMGQAIEHVKKVGMQSISLEVESGNPAAIALYEKCGFVVSVVGEPLIIMKLILGAEKTIAQ